MIEEEIEDTESQEEQELFEHFRFEVSAGTKPIRIDKYLANSIQNASRSKIQNAIDAESVLVNEKLTKASYKIKPDDIISVVFPDPPKDTTIAPENIPLNIVYEDDDVLIVNKVAGMVVHPGYNNVTGTLVNALAYHFKDLTFAQENNIRPGLVHRIDKNTSGLLVVAKNEFAMTFLAKQFFDHSIKRQYIALAWGDFDEDEGTVDGYIGRSNYDRRVFKMYKDDEIDKGKWSVTHYKVLERLHYVTLIECRLETGRTHQIRVHMKDIGHPLFADDTYGGDRIVKGTTFTKYKQFIDNCFDLCQRQALHARSIGFIHPTTKKEVFFETDLPSDMQAVIEKWRGYHKNVISKEDE
jgi:23S rRNA pseudouridine1911/1915/1917 synthase